MKGSRSTKGFLEHFNGHHIFVSMKEDNSKPPIHYHSGYDKAESALKNNNDGGKDGVFFTVNLLDEELDPGRHRTKKMVKECRAIFMDDDIPRDEPRADFPLVPSLIVNTSPGKYHYYWLIEGHTDDKETWSKVQNSLINLYEGDSNAKDLTRYLRLPGYKHNKKGAFRSTWSGKGKTYSWGELVETFPPSDSAKSKGNLTEATESKSVDSHVAELQNGINYHGSLISLTHQYKKEGMPDPLIIAALKGLMQGCSDELKAEDRWINRYNDIERDVTQYVIDSDDIELPEILDKEIVAGEMPWPPGLMGKLAEAALAHANYPRREIAIVTATAVLSGIAGRKFNINGTGLNTYQTLVAKTGSGKDAIPTFVYKLLAESTDTGYGLSYLGTGGFTGKKSVAKRLLKARSQINVISEQGLLMQSTAGDQEGLTAILLNAYGRSGKGQSLLGAAYSKEEDDVPNVSSPALSIVSESTPETLIQVLHDKGAMDNGSIARQSIFRIFGKRPNLNFQAHTATLPDEVKERIKELIAYCHNAQEHDVYSCKPISFGPFRERIEAIGNKYNDLHNELIDTDFVKSIMYSRAFVKYLKYAALVVVINTTIATLTEEALDWAEAMIDFEMGGLEAFFEGGSSGLYDDLIRGVVGKAIIKIINGKADKSISQSDATQRKKGIFPLNGPKQVLKNNKTLATLDNAKSFKAQDGYLRIVEYMIAYGLLVDVSTPKNKLLQVTSDFKTMMYDDFGA